MKSVRAKSVLVTGAAMGMGRMFAERAIAVVGGTDTPFDFTDADLTNGATYFYRVRAIGYNGLRSAPSARGPASDSRESGVPERLASAGPSWRAVIASRPSSAGNAAPAAAGRTLHRP